MDSTHGPTTPALNHLAQGIREYSLYQAVQLVLKRLQEAHPDCDEETLYERIEFQANPSLCFPGSDIDRVQFFEEHGELRARTRVTLLGLFGLVSPLSAFYSEQALRDSEDGNPPRVFLDLLYNTLPPLPLPLPLHYLY